MLCFLNHTNMAYKPLRMDKIKQIIDYHKKGYTRKKIARLLGISKNTVKKYIRQQKHDIVTKGVSDQDRERDNQLESLLPALNLELKKVGVTRLLLWEEYIQQYPEGFSYGRFCRKLKAYKAKQSVTLRLDHKAAHRLSVDYAGKRVEYIDKITGEKRYAEVLICTLPYSSYTFAYAVASQKQEDFIHAINQALLYIGGLPLVIQSDNLKSFVIKADRYDPSFNKLCIQLSSFYGVELEATRVAKPKDKANVERHVSIVYNKLYGPLRNRVFESIDQINEAFLPLIEKLNKTPLQGKQHSRYDLYAKDEKPHLSELPNKMFEIQKSTIAKVQRNYHVILGEDKHQYSVPYTYVGKQTEIVYDRSNVQIYCGCERIALHKRDYRKHGYSSLPIHMPEKHIRFLETRGWDESYFNKQAKRIGDNTLWAMREILKSKSLIEQTYNACLGLLRLEKKYTADRLEAACTKARTTHRVNYGIIKNILVNKTDKIVDTPDLFSLPKHENIRGSNEYI